MTMISAINNARCDAVLEGLRAEFGAATAARIMATEMADFLWEARVKEHYLGQHFDVWFGDEEDESELARIAILSLLDGRWHVASCLVDGEGMAVDLLWTQSFDRRDEAETWFECAL